ncbi:MAG: chemotaxis protein CheW [Myxococcales bacterium]|nr:chemotaxis protein CheW [Myxococcales bacterium]
MSESEDRRVRILRERAERLAAHGDRGGTRKVHLEIAIVSVGDERFGIPASGLREISALPSLTRLPGLPAWIRGITHARGELVSVVDLARWFEVKTDREPAFMVLLKAESGMLGLTVEEVLGFRPLHTDELGGADRAEQADRPISAVTNDLIAILDLDRLLGSEDLLVG